MTSAILSAEETASFRGQLDAEGRRLVLTNGCFDLLHAGHVQYLRRARNLGDALVVALNSDASVRVLKGEGRPVNTAEDRAFALTGLNFVDAVTVFDDKRVTTLVERVRPHIYAKGGDYTIESLHAGERAALEAAGADIRILPLVPGVSTTATLDSFEGPGRRPRLGVLGSGVGSNLGAILDAIDANALSADVVAVLSDKPGARILERARARDIPDYTIDTSSSDWNADIVRLLRILSVDLVVLAGFMRIVGEPLLSAFEGRILNIHPSLLPAFKGMRAWQQALEAGVAETGCTVHLVNAELDGGAILAQATVPVREGDTPETLHARIHEAEHVLYPQVIGEVGARLLGENG